MQNIKIISFMFFGAVVLLAIGYAVLVGDKAKIYVNGTVEVAAPLQEKGKAARTLFIILRDASVDDPPITVIEADAIVGNKPRRSSMPWGAYRDNVNFSINSSYGFTITKDNLQLMGQQSDPPSSFNIKVRLDRDGQGGADQPGDLVGTLQQVKRGSKDVRIILDQEVK